MEKKEKKVLFVATVVKTHINVFHIPFLKQFKDKGYKTYVAAKNDFKDEECIIPYCDEYYDLPFVRKPLDKENITAYRELKKIIDKEDFDIIHCHTPVGGVVARLAARAARKKGTRVIYTAHGFHFFKGAPLKNWLIYYTVEKLCSYFTDVLITINQEDYDIAKRKMKAKRIEYVAGVGVDTNKYNFSSEAREEMRKELALKDDDVMLFSAGELSIRKNHKLILQAMARLKMNNLHYYIAGVGDEEENLQKLSKELNIENNVHLLGFRKDVSKLFSATDIFAFPSLQEGLPIALIEAMSCSLPCIASKIRGQTDLLEGSEFLLELDDIDGFAAKIKLFAEDKQLCEKEGAKNRQISLNYNCEAILSTMSDIYDSQ